MNIKKLKPTEAQKKIMNDICDSGVLLEVASGTNAYLKRDWESARIVDKLTSKSKAASIGAVNVMIRNGWLSCIDEFDDLERKTHYRHYVLSAEGQSV